MNDIRSYYNKQTKEIEIYYGEEEEGGNIDLGILEAGNEIEKIIVVYNKLAYPINIRFEMDGTKIKIKEDFDNIPSWQKRNLTLLIDTKLTELEPPTSNLKLKISLLVT